MLTNIHLIFSKLTVITFSRSLRSAQSGSLDWLAPISPVLRASPKPERFLCPSPSVNIAELPVIPPLAVVTEPPISRLSPGCVPVSPPRTFPRALRSAQFGSPPISPNHRASPKPSPSVNDAELPVIPPLAVVTERPIYRRSFRSVSTSFIR